MVDSPRNNEEKLNRVLNAWKTLAPDKVFGGMRVDEYEADIKPSFTAREELEIHNNQATHLLNTRDNADEVSLSKTALIVDGVVGDPAFGPNSSLYEAMGYTRRSERKSGLHRKSSGSSPAPPTAEK